MTDAQAASFRDPAIGGEAGLAPFDEHELRAFVTERLPALLADGSFLAEDL